MRNQYSRPFLVSASRGSFRSLLADAAADLDPLAGCSLKFELYESDWEDGQLLVTAREGDTSWDRSQLDVGLGGGNLGGSQRSRR
jgi:hypothetical protein